MRELHDLHENWLIHHHQHVPASVVVVDADHDISDMTQVFAAISEKMMEDIKDDKENDNSDTRTIDDGKNEDSDNRTREKYDMLRRQNILTETN